MYGQALSRSPHAFEAGPVAHGTARALGRVLVLDLLLRNEDRLACSRLGWRGNPENILFTRRPLVPPKPVGIYAHLLPRGLEGIAGVADGTPGTVVVINSVLCRRQPSETRALDEAEYPGLIELLLNDAASAAEILDEISGGAFGHPSVDSQGCGAEAEPRRGAGGAPAAARAASLAPGPADVAAFQEGFRAAVEDLRYLLTEMEMCPSWL